MSDKYTEVLRHQHSAWHTVGAQIMVAEMKKIRCPLKRTYSLHLIRSINFGDILVGPVVKTFCLPRQGLWAQSPVRVLISHMHCGQKAKPETEAIL